MFGSSRGDCRAPLPNIAIGEVDLFIYYEQVLIWTSNSSGYC